MIQRIGFVGKLATVSEEACAHTAGDPQTPASRVTNSKGFMTRLLIEQLV